MDSPGRLQAPAHWPLLFAWGVFAAVAGLCCLVLPPHLTPRGLVNPGYGRPLVPWFAAAFANLDFIPSVTAMFVLGAGLGLARPRRWLLMGLLTVSLTMFLWGVNFTHELAVDSTSHNLFPFEIAMVLFFALPAVGAAAWGDWSDGRSGRHRSRKSLVAKRWRLGGYTHGSRAAGWYDPASEEDSGGTGIRPRGGFPQRIRPYSVRGAGGLEQFQFDDRSGDPGLFTVSQSSIGTGRWLPSLGGVVGRRLSGGSSPRVSTTDQ